MLDLNINIEGKTESDLLDAIDYIRGNIEVGMTSGFDRNDSGQYKYEINGDEEA